MREGAVGACHGSMADAPCEQGGSEKDNSRDGGRRWESGLIAGVKSGDLPRRGDYAQRGVTPKPQVGCIKWAKRHDPVDPSFSVAEAPSFVGHCQWE